MKSIHVLVCILLGYPTIAQQMGQDSSKVKHLEHITIVGDRAKSIPGSGQYINNHTLEKLNQPNINNVLRIIPGVNIRDEEGFGLRPNIGLRGTPVNRCAKITLMEDGVLIAPAPYADPAAYYFPSFARMQGIEVLKGSSQIKYGPYTIGGAVNLLSTSIPTHFKGFAQLAYGCFGTHQQRIWLGDSRKNIDYVFEVNRMASQGFKQLDSKANTGFQRRDVLGKIRWHTSEKAKMYQAVTLKMTNTIEEGNETYLGLTYQDYKANPLKRYAGTQKDILDLKHHQLSLLHSIVPIQNLAINTTIYYHTTFRDWARANTFGNQSIASILANPTLHQTSYEIMIGKENGEVIYQNAARTYAAKGIQSNMQYMLYNHDFSHKLQIGFRYHTDEADRYATRSTYQMTNGTMIQTAVDPKGNQENQIRKANSLATYLSYDISYKSLKLSPGIRYENIHFSFDNYGINDNARLGTALKSATNSLSIVLPGIGIQYNINSNMSTFGGVHKGFSPPGMPSVSLAAAQAKAEKSVNYEIGYRINKSEFNAQLVSFLNSYDNILGSDNVSGGGAGTGDVFNAGKAQIHGLEINVEYNVLHNQKRNTSIKLPISIAYTYTKAIFKETFVNGGGDWGTGTIFQGDWIPFITPHMFTAGIGLETKKINTTLVGRYTSETRVKPGQGKTTIPSESALYNNVNAIAGFLILDLSANYKCNKSISVFTTINNITNSKSIIANLPQGYRPNMPISYNIGIKAYF